MIVNNLHNPITWKLSHPGWFDDLCVPLWCRCRFTLSWWLNCKLVLFSHRDKKGFFTGILKKCVWTSDKFIRVHKQPWVTSPCRRLWSHNVESGSSWLVWRHLRISAWCRCCFTFSWWLGREVMLVSSREKKDFFLEIPKKCIWTTNKWNNPICWWQWTTLGY